MPVIFEYLLKLSISIAVIHLFYLLVLRRLTFYNLNRWYLAGYTVLCFAIPFVDVSAITAGAGDRSVVHIIPTVQAISGKTTTRPVVEVSQATDWWQIGLYVLTAGSAILILRLTWQLFALRKIKRTATAISDGDTAIYHTDKQITPFSFGNNIYLNKNLHTEAELEEIILHEYVHVKQLHTFDIILAELLCIINWYNPFAWFMRHSIRQNLEYIADDNVVNTGVDKKAYQYHLLKVIGIPQYRIANQFNFSSLKNRIMMMNKVRSAKINLLKFMFILPLLAVILVAFRNQLLPEPKEQLTYAVIFYDLDTYKRLSNVEMSEIYGNKSYKADAKGYVAIPTNLQKDQAMHISMAIKKDGYLKSSRKFMFPVAKLRKSAVIELIGLSKSQNVNCKECTKFLATMNLSSNSGVLLEKDADYFYDIYTKRNATTAERRSLKIKQVTFTDKNPEPILDSILKKKSNTSLQNIKAKKHSIIDNGDSIQQKESPKSTMSAEDSVVYDSKKKMATLYGNVKIQDADKTITANKIVVPQPVWYKWTSALVLIDGIEHTIEDLQTLDEKSVTSIEVLNDASATSIYGSRAINGVVKVQTKKAVEIKKF